MFPFIENLRVVLRFRRQVTESCVNISLQTKSFLKVEWKKKKHLGKGGLLKTKIILRKSIPHLRAVAWQHFTGLLAHGKPCPSSPSNLTGSFFPHSTVKKRQPLSSLIPLSHPFHFVSYCEREVVVTSRIQTKGNWNIPMDESIANPNFRWEWGSQPSLTDHTFCNPSKTCLLLIC